MQAGVFSADLTKLGLTAADFGSLPDIGHTIHICDQLTSLKMQLFHEGRCALVLGLRAACNCALRSRSVAC